VPTGQLFIPIKPYCIFWDWENCGWHWLDVINLHGLSTVSYPVWAWKRNWHILCWAKFRASCSNAESMYNLCWQKDYLIFHRILCPLCFGFSLWLIVPIPWSVLIPHLLAVSTWFQLNRLLCLLWHFNCSISIHGTKDIHSTGFVFKLFNFIWLCWYEGPEISLQKNKYDLFSIDPVLSKWMASSQCRIWR